MAGKKGDLEYTTFVKIIGILASFIVIVFLFRGIFDLTYGETAENVCRMSVVSHSNMQAAGSPIMNLKCPRKFITFDNKGYKQYYADELPIDSSKLSYKTKFDKNVPLKEQFYEILANEMGECWYKMGEGELDVFHEDLFFTNPSCLVCAQIDFSKEFDKTNDLGTVGDFNDYLENNNFSKYGINKKYSKFLYKDYPSSFSLSHLAFFKENDQVQMLYDDNTRLSPDRPYLVYFKAYKFDKTSTVLNYLGDKLVGESINRIFPNDRYYVYFGGQDDITKSCYMMVN